MGAIADLWQSERGLLALALIISATVLAALGIMTEASWREYTLYIFGFYAAAKTVTSVVETHTGAKNTPDVTTDTTTTEDKPK